ncbi:FG-GAP-like repeat-containing protein [Amycolatopsis solani]|uniref:FG-GAP-like repeat-containing protein n=1 Tax=Amycolatopsis solani TaxID=3028615 RepID=UPI00296E9613|nr:FG-GAP-like repeat-containing protein [Amycolatopsis sp. MEP2-6]
MHKLRTLALVPLAGLATGILTASPAEAISNAAGAADGVYAFTAKLSNETAACTGALVAPQWIITSAGCFPQNPQGGAPAKPTTVTVGRTKLGSTGGHVATVTSLVARSDRGTMLARLDTPITDIAPVSLGTAAPATGYVLRVAGYGRTTSTWAPDQLQTGAFTVASTGSTQLTLTGDQGADACKGDAGGPVFREDAGRTSLAGVVTTTWGHGCLVTTETRQGTTADRTDDLVDWIRQQVLAPSAKAVGHSITVSWNALAAQDSASYRVYSSTTTPVPIDAAHLAGTTQTTTLTQTSVPAKQTRYYQVIAATADGRTTPASTVASASTPLAIPVDFTGDGKADIATFTRGAAGHVYVAGSDGTKFVGNSVLWHDRFSIGTEIPLSGDFNGDGKADVATFARGTSGDVYVALSDGTKFNGNGVLWHDYFGIGDELPAVGDFNGDGKDDIAVFKRGSTGDVIVALSDGTKFGTPTLWHDFFGINDELPAVGDFNGDGKDDIVVFTRSTTGDVYIATSDGTKFNGTSVKWHDNFAFNSEIPSIGDFNGDGKDDLVVFTRGSASDAFVATSDGTKFVGTSAKWHDHFAAGDEIPAVGDFTGDGKDDIATFTRSTTGDVYVATSDGTKFVGDSIKWHDNFAFNSEVPAPRAITIL